MLTLKKVISSTNGKKLISIILGLGLASIFKMSCDSRSCLVYKGSDMSEDNIIKYNGKCYETNEKMETCDIKKKKNRSIIM